MKKNTLDDFEKKFRVTPGCWIWIGNCAQRGYGRFRWQFGDMAHRFSYDAYIGPIPDGMQVCHRCDNPRCVNPDHLFIGSNQDNVNDKVRKGRHPKGEQSATAKLTEAQVIEARSQYKKGSTKFGTRSLARKFGISHKQMWLIVTYKGWVHVL